MSKRTILVIEEKKILGKLIEDYLSTRGSGCAVLLAASIPEAVGKARDTSVDLVVVDHKGVGKIDRVELLSDVRLNKTPVRMILSCDEGFAQDNADAHCPPFDAILFKPYSVNRLSEMVFKMLQPERGFSGRLLNTRLEGVIEMLCFRRDSAVLTIFNSGGRGVVYVHEGEIVHAQCDLMIGVEAFYEIMGWETGQFISQTVVQLPAQTVFLDWQTLLMEGTRQKDEIRHALDHEPYAMTSPEVQADSRIGSAPVPARDASVSAGPEPVMRIMIVDDSYFIRKIVQEILQSDQALQVAGYATNGQEALAQIEALKPDLILLDWDMPVMMGSTTLMHIMIKSPCPVVILSGFVGGQGASPFDMLCLGAVDFLRKPQSKWRTDGRADDMIRRIKRACAVRSDHVRRIKVPQCVKEVSSEQTDTGPPSFLTVFGSSIGGCSDLIRLIPALPVDLPSAVIALHDMQAEAIGAFIEYLDRKSCVAVLPSQSGALLKKGVCYIHPAMVPLELTIEGGRPCLKILSETAGCSVLDDFLVSAAKIMKADLLAVLLSGAPDGGLEGLRAVKESGGITLAQDPGWSMDPRMAEAALQAGLIDRQCIADNLVEALSNLVRGSGTISVAPVLTGELP